MKQYEQPKPARKYVKEVAVLLLTCSCVVRVGFAEEAGSITFATLLAEMQDRTTLARHPDGGYTQHQASSYNRDLEGEGDVNHFIRTEQNSGRTERVMLEDNGPGAIVRGWFGGRPDCGVVRIYIDGATEPTFEGPSHSFFGDHEKIPEPLSHHFGGKRHGYVFYWPIPYQKGIKITFEAPKGYYYYCINYRRYAPGTKVDSLSPATLDEHQPVLKDTVHALKSPVGPEGSDLTYAEARTAPGKSDLISLTLDGPSAIREIQVDVEGLEPGKRIPEMDVVLRFDGLETTRVPLGHFFGCGRHLHDLKQDWYRRVDAQSGRFTSWWVMPFGESAELQIVNRSDEKLKLSARVGISPWTWDDRSMRFHSRFVTKNRIMTQKGRVKRDAYVRYAKLEGIRGVYAGDTLEIQNGAPGWWGEGDEHIFVDNPDHPAHIGTGTEDYYNYSYGSDTTFPFSFPFFSQPYGKGNSAIDHSVNTRVRGLDAIPFERFFDFKMEVRHWAATTIDYAVCSHWYEVPR